MVTDPKPGEHGYRPEPRTDYELIVDYVDLVEQCLKSLDARHMATWQRVERVRLMGAEMRRVADMLVDLSAERDDGK